MPGSNPSKLGWILPIVILLGFGAALIHGHRVQGELAARKTHLETALDAQPRLTAPGPTRVALVAPPVVVPTALPDDATALPRLRAELARLTQRVTEREAALRQSQAAAKATAKPSLLQESVGYQEWQNVGQATPEAMIETALWAGAGGDLDILEKTIRITDDAAVEAQALFDRLPPNLQSEYQSPSRLITLMAASDVPLGSAQVSLFASDPTHQNVVVQMRVPDQKPALSASKPSPTRAPANGESTSPFPPSSPTPPASPAPPNPKPQPPICNVLRYK